MPGYDGRGPMWGGGPGAGWGHGHCCNIHGWHQMFSRCCGYGRRFGKEWTKEDELKMLDNEETAIKKELEEIQKAKQELQSTNK